VKGSEKEVLKQLLSVKDLDPMVRKVCLKVPEPSLKDNRGDVDRVLDTLEKKEGIQRASVSLSMVGRISEVLHVSGFKITLTLSLTAESWDVIDVEGGDHCRANYGVAVDLGSTNIVFYLLDLWSGEIVGETSDVNPQIRHGEDILSRIHYCENPGGLQELQGMVIQTLNRNIGVLLRKHGIEKRHLYALAVAGNTIQINGLTIHVPLTGVDMTSATGDAMSLDDLDRMVGFNSLSGVLTKADVSFAISDGGELTLTELNVLTMFDTLLALAGL